MGDERQPKVGDVVIWHDPTGVPHNALLTAVWSPTYVNLVIVSGDETRTDSYGRQIERNTSQTHKSQTKVHGNYWRYEDEEPNPYVPPQQT